MTTDKVQQLARAVHVHEFVTTELWPYHEQHAARIGRAIAHESDMYDTLQEWSKYYCNKKKSIDRVALVKHVADNFKRKAVGARKHSEAHGVEFSLETLYMSWKQAVADTPAHASKRLKTVRVLSA
jgi:hypothetical protein